MERIPLEDMSMEEDNLRNVVAGNTDHGSPMFSYPSIGGPVVHLSFDSPNNMTVTRSRSAMFTDILSQSLPHGFPHNTETSSPTETITSTPSMNTRRQTAVRECRFLHPMEIPALLTPPPETDTASSMNHSQNNGATTHSSPSSFVPKRSPDQLLRARELLVHASPVKKRLHMTLGKSEVANQIRALSHDQAIQSLLAIYQTANPFIAQDIERVLPSPDLRPSLHTLNNLLKNIHRNIPTSKTFRMSAGSGSNRDVACFRVTRHNIAEFKVTCLDQAQSLVNLEQWNLTIDYVLKAWRYVDDLPEWDNPAHNSYKQSCFRTLSKHCQTALTYLSLDVETCKRLHEKLMWANDLNSEMKPCLKMLERRMSDNCTSVS